MALDLDNCSLLYCYRLLFAALEELKLTENTTYRDKDCTDKQQLTVHITTLRAAIDGKMSEQAVTLAQISDKELRGDL
tara:strand:+ start:1269 stop:1502 length:234 start_codon:yes stop_codon:yes gene_type:complete